MIEDGITRRAVLQSAGAAAGTTAFAGLAAGRNGPEPRIVGTASPEAERSARRRAESVDRTIDFDHIGKAVVGRFSDEAARNLRRRDDVRYVERNGTYEKLGETLPWGIDRIDADRLHADGDTADGATVAVLDTGIDDDHPDLSANVVGGKAFETECGAEKNCRFGLEGYNGNDCNYEWSDDDDHGSHVSGTADADDNTEGVIGVATEADLLAGKVLTGCGSGSYSAIASGVKWATDQGADVINMSLGGDSGSSTLKDACQYAYDNNVVTVAAAGNDGPCTDCVSYPAKYSTVVAVSATTPNDTLADYSSTGPEVELAAPGGANDGNDSTSVYSTIPPESDDSGSPDGYAYFVGTSMASPHVAGAAAQVKAETSLSDNQQIIDRLKSTAEDIGLASNESGAGLVDAEAAVGSSDPSPTVDSLSASEVETSDGDAEFDVSWSVSDDEGDLSSVDIYLLDSSGATEDSVTGISVSGSSASGTNRLVASGDEGTGDSYTVELTVTDSNSNSTTSSVSAAESEDAPNVDGLSVDEVETSDGDAEFDVSWDVSDADGDLASVDLSLADDTDGESEDSASISVSGSSASETTRLVAAGDDGTGNSYTVTATVSDTDGTSNSASTSVSESENAAPSASIDAINDKSNPRWERYEVDWSASDSDGNLDTVVVELLDSSGNVEDSVTTDVSGSSASGVDEVRTKSSADVVEVTATDTAGASGSDSQDSGI